MVEKGRYQEIENSRRIEDKNGKRKKEKLSNNHGQDRTA